MGFVSNIFRKATKDIKLTFSARTGNAIISDNVEGYNKAVIQFSATPSVRFLGYIEKATDSVVITNDDIVKTDIHGKPVFGNVTKQNVIVDISNLAFFYMYFAEDYTGDVYVHLTQDEVKPKYNGITVLATKTINIVAGTNYYELGFVDNFKNFRFWAIEAKRRDGNGYAAFAADFVEYHKIPKTTGAGPGYSGGETILSVTTADAPNGYAQSEWLENYSNSNSVDVRINGTDYDGAVLEVTFLGIA